METRYHYHIMMGLPASGKTHYCKTSFNNPYDDTYPKHHIDMDYFMYEERDYENILRVNLYDMKRRYGYSFIQDVDVAIDGLILTKEELKQVIKTCLSSTYSKKTPEFIIHVWNCDRKTCEHNDNYRVKTENSRDKSSIVTIKNAKFDDDINVSEIETCLNDILDENEPRPKISVVRHEVYKMNIYDIKVKKFKNTDKKSDKLVSERWSKGGTYGSCWDDNLTPIHPDNEKDFKEFDDMLMEVCPNISYLQYKKIYNECVTQETDSEHDYYGGCEYYGYWTCDLKKFYEILLEMNLISEII